MSGNTEGKTVSLADASIEEIERMALEAEAAKGGEGDQAGAAKTEDVSTASSGQSKEEQVKAGEKGGESDKDKNFANLRTKLSATEEENRRIAAENERLQAELKARTPDVKIQVAEVDGEISGLAEKFQDGEITWEDYQTQLNEANARRAGLIEAAAEAAAREKIAKEQAELTEKQKAERAAQEWQDTADKFIGASHDGVDYSKDEGKFNDLNTYIKALAKDPDNADKDNQWFLETAHSLVRAKHNIAAIPGSPDKGADKGADKSAESVAKPAFASISELPGGMPAARNEVEQLEGMSGAALTNRFANMTSDQIDKELAKLG